MRPAIHARSGVVGNTNASVNTDLFPTLARSAFGTDANVCFRPVGDVENVCLWVGGIRATVS